MTRSGMPRAFSLLVAGHGWVRVSPSGIASSGCLSRHSRTTSGRCGIRVPKMNDNPAACRATWLASEIIPASATTVTSDSWWAALKALITGSIVAVSALLPSNASTVSGNPAASVSSPRVICGSRRRLLGEPGLTEPVTGIGLEVQRRDVEQHQARRPQPRHALRMPQPAIGASRVGHRRGRRRLTVAYDAGLDTDFASAPAPRRSCWSVR